MKAKRILSVALSAIMIIGAAVPVAAEPASAEQSVETEQQPIVENSIIGGYIPSDLDKNTPIYEPEIEAYSDEVIPTAYPDGGVETIKSKYPDVRNQNPYGTCWAFSSIGLSEFDLINKNMVDRKVNFSELQLAYFTYNSVVDPLGGTQGDLAIYHNENTDTNYLMAGGTYEYAVRRLSQWVGPVDETKVPYSGAADSITNAIDSSNAYGEDEAHLQNAYEINIKSQPEEVKKQIMKHGAVGVNYQHHWGGENNLTNSYYDKSTTFGNYGGHAVMIVGWDDDYAVDNFAQNEKPTNKGAWLVRNNWGDTQLPYFWMSYETESLNPTAWVFDVSSQDGYDNNYQLDGTLETQIDQYYKSAANVFKVSTKSGVESETLKAVSLSFLNTADVGYTIDIYTDLTDAKNPLSGTKSATVSGRTTYAGYYTIPINSEVTLKPGSTFAIAVTTDKKALEYDYATSTSKNPSDQSSPIIWNRTANKNYDESENSLYYAYNKYATAPHSNYRIKAFTSNNATQTDVGEKFYAGSVTLNGSLDLNFYMDLPDNVVNNANTYLQFTTEDDSIYKVNISEAKIKQLNDKTYYMFSCPLYAMEMADQVKAQIYVGEQSGKEFTFSIKKYAEQQLNNNQIDNNTINVIKAMLNYGASAQKFFEYKTNDLANSSLTSDDTTLNNIDLAQYKYSKEGSAPGINYQYSTLILNAETAVRDYFKIESGHSIDEYTFTRTDLSGNPIKLNVQKKSGEDDLYYVEISGIKAYELNQMPVVQVKNNSGSSNQVLKVTYGPFSYGYIILNNNYPDTLKNVINMLYSYWYYADQFVKSQN